MQTMFMCLVIFALLSIINSYQIKQRLSMVVLGRLLLVTTIVLVVDCSVLEESKTSNNSSSEFPGYPILYSL